MVPRLTLAFIAGLMLTASVKAQAPANPRTDFLGDPLPEGAIARLGTLRLKHTPELDPTLSRVLISPDGMTFVSFVGTLRLWTASTGKEIPGPWTASDKRFVTFAISPDGATLAAVLPTQGKPDIKGGPPSPNNFEIFLWNIATGKLLQTLRVPPNSAQAVTFSDFGKTLVSAGNGTVAWWDIASGKELKTWKPFKDEEQPLETGGIKTKTFTTCALSPDALSIAIEVGWRYHAPEGDKVKSSPPREPLGQREAVGFDIPSRTVRWRSTTKVINRPIAFAFSGNGKRVAIALGLEQVEVRDTHTGKLVVMPPEVGFWQIKWTGTEAYVLEFEQPGPTPIRAGGLALSPDGRLAAFMGIDSQVALWHVDDPAVVRNFTTRVAQYWGSSTRCASFSPDGKTLLVAADADMQVFDVATLKEINASDGHRGWLDFVAFSPDGKRLMTGSGGINPYSQEFASWDTTTWKRLQVSSLRTPPWSHPGLPNPQLTLYVGGPRDRFGLYEMSTGKLLGKLQVPAGSDPQERGFFSPSGKLHVLLEKPAKVPVKKVGASAKASVYSVPSGKLLCELPPLVKVSPMASEQPIAFSHDDRLVALVNQQDRMIHIIETATGKTCHTMGKKLEGDQKVLAEKGGYLANLAFSPDGATLASWTMLDPVVRLWDVQSGKEKLQMPQLTQAEPKGPGPYRGGAVHFAWSPDGRVLAAIQLRWQLDSAGGQLRTVEDRIQLWELASLGVRREFVGHQGAVRALAFSPDGKLLATGSADTTVLIWDSSLPVGNGPLSGPQAAELESHWQALADSNAAKAFKAMGELAGSPKESLALIRDKLKPAAAVEEKRVQELIVLLEDNLFKVRQKAIGDLSQMGEQIVPTIDKTLAANPPLETRLRLQEIRSRLTGLVLQGSRLQAYRAVELLERNGSPQAQELLQVYADGPASSLLAIQARAALERLRKMSRPG